MKKMFLFISIILLMFGFSANPNVVNSIFKNKNENNIKKSSAKEDELDGVLANEDDEFDILYNEDGSPDMIVTPTTATVKYTYSSNKNLKEESNALSWSSSWDEGFDDNGNYFYGSSANIIAKKSLEEIQNDDELISNDEYWSYSGTISTKSYKDLYSPNTYEKNYLTAYKESGGSIKTEGNGFRFTTPSLKTYTKTYTKPGQNLKIKSDEITTHEDSAEIKFSFVPSRVEYTNWTADNDTSFTTETKNIPPVRMDWVDEDGGILGSTNSFEETKEGSETEKGEYTTSIETGKGEEIDRDGDGKTEPIKGVEAGETYNGTKLIIYDQFAEYEDNPEEYIYESQPFSFSVNDEASNEPSLTKEGDVSAENKSAEIDYRIIPGVDGFGKEQEVEKVWWENSPASDSDGQTFASTPDLIEDMEEDPNSSGQYTGTLLATELEPNKNYTTTLKATLSKKDGSTYEIELENITFETLGAEAGVVELGEDGLEFAGGDATEATINYEITPAKDTEGIQIDPTSISWIDLTNEDGGSNVLATNSWGENQFNDSDKNGSLTAKKLTPGTNYDNTILKVEDGAEPYELTEIDSFQTTNKDSVGEVEGTNLTQIDEHNEMITYTITPANDIHKNPITPLSISWINEDTGNPFEGESTHQIDSLKEEDLTGTLFATNLDANKDYNSILKVEDKNEPYSSTKIPFKTQPADEISGKVIQDGKVVTESSTASNNATVNFKIFPAYGIDEKEIEPYGIKWIDDEYGEKTTEHSKEVLSKTKFDENNLEWIESEKCYEGKLTAKGLSDNESYNTSLHVYSNASDYTNEKDDGTFVSATSIEFETKTTPIPGTIETTSMISKNKYDATVEFKITPTKNDSGNPIPSDKTKITWMQDLGDEGYSSDDQILGDGGVITKAGEEDENGVYTGELTVSELISGTTYENTYLHVDDGDEKYNSIDNKAPYIGDGDEGVFNTASGEDEGEIIASVVEAKNDFVTIKYTITPAQDKYSKPCHPTKIEWIDHDDNNKVLDSKDLSSSSPTNSNGDYEGELTASNLEPNKNYDNTELIVIYEIPPIGDSAELDGEINYSHSFKAGNFKTQKMIIYGSSLAVLIVVFAIISFFTYGWFKRRRVN